MFTPTCYNPSEVKVLTYSEQTLKLSNRWLKNVKWKEPGKSKFITMVA